MKKFLVCLCAAMLLGLGTPIASSAKTLVGDAFWASYWQEENLWDIYNDIYDTSLAGAADLMELEIDKDKVWYQVSGGMNFVALQAQAKYAGNFGGFGYYTDLEIGGSGDVLFLTPSNSGYTTGNTNWGWINYLDPVIFSVDKTFGFFYTPASNVTGQTQLVSGDTFYSEMLLNPGGHDNMLTYITPNPGEYLMAWADTPVTFTGPYTESEQDFNDLVIAVRGAAPVPEPATMLLLGSGLIGLAVFGRKKLFK